MTILYALQASRFHVTTYRHKYVRELCRETASIRHLGVLWLLTRLKFVVKNCHSDCNDMLDLQCVLWWLTKLALVIKYLSQCLHWYVFLTMCVLLWFTRLPLMTKDLSLWLHYYGLLLGYIVWSLTRQSVVVKYLSAIIMVWFITIVYLLIYLQLPSICKALLLLLHQYVFPPVCFHWWVIRLKFVV